MIARILRALRWRRRRSTTHLTPGYEARRVARLSLCQAQFKAGKVGAYFEPLKTDAAKAQAMFSGELG